MNSETFDSLVQYQFKQIEKTLLNKAAEYATDEDRLHNFKIAAHLSQNTELQACWGFLVKHLVSISDMVKADGKVVYPTEVWNEKVGDALNYLILLRAIEFDNEDERLRADNQISLDITN